jgi:hypothetical protein
MTHSMTGDVMTVLRQRRTLWATGLVAVLCAMTGACSNCGDESLQTDASVDDASRPDALVDVIADVDGGQGGEDIAVPDAGDGSEHPRTPAQAGVSPDGHPDQWAELSAEEVRLARLTTDDTGFSGVDSHCRKGDFLLYNSVIAVCIQAETTNRLESFTGGFIVDARRRGDTGEEVLDFMIPLTELRTKSAREVKVVRDGTDGLAVLRVEGSDMDIAYLTNVAGTRIGSPLGLEMTTEYRLRPGSDAIEIVTWYRKTEARRVTFHAGDLFVWGDRGRPWSPGLGFEVGQGPRPWMAGVGRGKSFAVVYEDQASPLGVVASQGLPWAELRASRITLDGDEEKVLRRWFVVGDGTLDSVRQGAARVRGEAWTATPHVVEVVDTAGVPVANVRVVIRDAQGKFYTHGTTAADGKVRLELEPGQAYSARLEGLAGQTSEEVEGLQFDDESTARVEVAQAGRLNLTVTEAGANVPLTARVEARGPRNLTFFAVKGSLDIDLPVGRYRLVVTRGPQYDHVAFDIDVVAGQTSTHSAALVRGLDTAGWRTGDFHQHMEPSPDSTIEVRERVLDNVTSGVELIVPTDHDVITDLRPIIAELGLGDVVSSFPGVEISPGYAHMNMYPMPYDPNRRGRGTIELARMVDGDVLFRRFPDVIAVARGLDTDPIVQLNHPRSNAALFQHVRFDPELGPEAVEHPDFTVDFDAMEIVNRPRDTCQLMVDWSGLLNAGKMITGMGNSDSHSLNGRAGVPRTYLRIDAGPGEITPAHVREAIRNQRASVGAHAFIDFSDAMVPGDLIESQRSTTVTFRPRVQTPDWAEATRLFVIVNGHIVESFERSADAGARLDFEETVELTFEQDSWVVFFASGPQPSGDVRIGVPVIAFTNPVFVDVDGDANGDGRAWEAPGVGPLNLDALFPGLCD